MGGLFGSDSPLFGIEKSRTEEETSTMPDPETEKMNALRRQQLQDALKATGGYAKLFGPGSDRLFQLDPNARRMLQVYMQQARQPGLTPEQWYQQARANVDPTTQIHAAQGILQNILTPQLQNRYAQMGLGRSGALGEGIAMAGQQLALPIAQQASQQRFELDRQRPNTDATLRAAQLARTQQAFGAADFNRQLALANWQRKVAGMTSGLNLVPYVAGSLGTGVSRNYGNIMWDLMQMTAGLAAAVMGASYTPQQTPQSSPGGMPSGTTPGVPTAPGMAPTSTSPAISNTSSAVGLGGFVV